MKYLFLFSIWVSSLFLLYDTNLIKRNQNISQHEKHYDNLGIVDIYYYTNIPSMTDSSPNIMADGTPVYDGALAISRDLLKDLMFNDCVMLEYDDNQEYFIVGDLMAKRHTKSVDIFTFEKTGLNKRHKGRLYLVR